MKKRLLSALLICGSLVLGTQLVFAASPDLRTRAYFAFYRGWISLRPPGPAFWLPEYMLWFFHPSAAIWYEPEPQMKMLLDPFDRVPRLILITGGWEPELGTTIERHLPPGGTLIDVGAHIGYFSLKGAKKAGPAGQVIAIEPNPDTLRVLRGNIAANNARTIQVEPSACSNAEQMLEFYASGESNTGESSLSRTNATQEFRLAATYKVRARTLDSIVRERNLARVDVLKIDVEGAEMMVLEGARETLTRFHPIIVIELVKSQLRAMGTSEAAVREYLRDAGYAPGTRIGRQNAVFVPAR